MIAECSQCSAVCWHCIIGEVASDHLLEPTPLFGDWMMHSPSQFLLDPPERHPHAIASCAPLDEELSTTVAFADKGKAQEVEGFRLAEPASLAAFRREASELDESGLLGMQRQRK